MRNKPPVPDEIEPGSEDYSFQMDICINAWLWIAVLTSFVGEVFLLPSHKKWPASLRAIVALIPLIAGLLWVRRVLQWVRSMDELQRRIVISASIFATVATLLVIATFHLLAVANIIPIHFQTTATFVLIWLVVCFYILGRTIFKRRYQ